MWWLELYSIEGYDSEQKSGFQTWRTKYFIYHVKPMSSCSTNWKYPWTRTTDIVWLFHVYKCKQTQNLFINIQELPFPSFSYKALFHPRFITRQCLTSPKEKQTYDIRMLHMIHFNNKQSELCLKMCGWLIPIFTKNTFAFLLYQFI